MTLEQRLDMYEAKAREEAEANRVTAYDGPSDTALMLKGQRERAARPLPEAYVTPQYASDVYARIRKENQEKKDNAGAWPEEDDYAINADLEKRERDYENNTDEETAT